jgi:hypothetical protein
MKNRTKAILIVLFLSVFIWLISCGKQKEEWKGTIKDVDGVTVVKNPEFPIKGTIILEVEKILEINPYDNPDIGIRYFHSAKDEDGEVILFDSNRAEAHRFSSKGEYIGSLIRTLKRQWREDGQLRRVTLVNLAIKEDIVFFEAVREWLIRKGDSAFNDPWATPSIYYAYCPFSDKVFTAINEEYKIYVYDLEGKVIQIIERPYKYVKVNLEDKKKFLPWAAKEESWKWAFSAYPDTLSAIKDLAILPKGYLAVYRIVGPKKFEIDVYGADGKLVYILKLPEGITLERAKFYDFGFTTQMTRDEFPVYCEFKIKNVPEIFNN